MTKKQMEEIPPAESERFYGTNPAEFFEFRRATHPQQVFASSPLKDLLDNLCKVV
ncbi:MAG: hypothetical protein ABIH40_05000 [Candidatus Omnitrophota bacterium]